MSAQTPVGLAILAAAPALGLAGDLLLRGVGANLDVDYAARLSGDAAPLWFAALAAGPRPGSVERLL